MNKYVLLMFMLPAFTFANEKVEPCSYGVTYGNMLSDKQKSQIAYLKPIKTWSRTGGVAHLQKETKGKYNSATDLAFQNTSTNENYFAIKAKKLAVKFNHKCYGVANVRHDFKVDNGNIYLFSYGDLYITN
mgnify:FL=1